MYNKIKVYSIIDIKNNLKYKENYVIINKIDNNNNNNLFEKILEKEMLKDEKTK